MGPTPGGKHERERGAAVLASMRRKQILEELQARRGVRLTDLSKQFLVSEMTIRRDLDVLERSGIIERVHGGAVLAQAGTDEPGFEKKALRETEEKGAIAAVAARLVKPGSAIALSAGTTTLALARALPAVGQLTVVTNSMNVWRELQAGRSGPAVILTGGEFRTPSDALVGPTAEAAIRSLYFDVLFLGVHGIDPVAGLTTPNISEAETNRALIARCRRLVVVADHTKWRVAALCTMAEVADVDTLVSDEGLPHDARRYLENQVRQLLIAPTGKPAAEVPGGG